MAFWSSCTVASAPSRSALLTQKTSAISSTPALAAWTPSPIPGARSTTVVSASATTSISDCPTPTVSTSTTSHPAASRTRSACGAAAVSPPRCPRVAIERMNTPGSVAWSLIRTRSPSSAPPENGELGSTARTPTRRSSRTQGSDERGRRRRLPDPGGPGEPDDDGVPGMRRQGGREGAGLRRSAARPAVLHQGDQPRDGAGRAVPGARDEVVEIGANGRHSADPGIPAPGTDPVGGCHP